jgi:hypothetical protein
MSGDSRQIHRDFRPCLCFFATAHLQRLRLYSTRGRSAPLSEILSQFAVRLLTIELAGEACYGLATNETVNAQENENFGWRSVLSLSLTLRTFTVLSAFVCFLFSVASAGTTFGVNQPANSSIAQETTPVILLSDMGDALKKLDEMQRALDQAQQGKVPVFGTRLGDVAQKLDKAADDLDKQNAAGAAAGAKPSVHKPGFAIAEMQQHLQELRFQKEQFTNLENKLIVERRQVKRMAAVALRLAEGMKNLASNPLLPPEQRPLVDNYLIDSDHLSLALSSCLTSLTRIQTRVESQLPVLTRKIANGEANLNDPRVREIISSIDTSRAATAAQVNASIETTKSDIAKRDLVNTSNALHSLQHPPQAAVAPSVRPPPRGVLPPLRPSGGCPSGYIEMNGLCVALSMQPH